MIEEMKKRTRLIVLFVVIAVLSSPKAYGEISPAEIQKKMESAIQIEQKAQKKADKWAEEKQNILAELQDLKHREQWLDFQQKKYNGYIKEEEKILENLTRKKEEFEKIKMDLEPYLEDVYQELKSFVENDLNFLLEERQKRLLFLRESLDDYRVGLSEKLRRILEALQVEANYGRSIEKTDGILNLQGEKMEVSFLRIGRLALFFLSADRKKVGYLDKKTGQWKFLDHKYAKYVLKGIEMAERKRAIELVDLPIGKWETVKRDAEKRDDVQK